MTQVAFAQASHVQRTSEPDAIAFSFAVQHLPLCDRVIVMSEGRIVAAGTFAELEEAKQSSPQLQVVPLT
jgi:ABC-type Na+ transport system ATPase subunit NatA